MAKNEDESKPVEEEETDEASAPEGEEASDGDDEGERERSDGEGEALDESASLALRSESDELVETGDEAEEAAAAQLGIDRYVLAGFFASGLIGAYVLGRTLQAIWVSFSNRDWFSQALPRLAGLTEDEKTSYSFVVAGIAALIIVVRVYRRPDVRTWADDVAAELSKVKGPSKKEVYNSTFIVIVASAAATLYLALLDRLWAFVTNIVYGDGS